MSMVRHRFSNERWGGGGGARTTSLSYSINALHERKTYHSVNLALAGDPQQNNDQLATDKYQFATDKNQLTTRN